MPATIFATDKLLGRPWFFYYYMILAQLLFRLWGGRLPITLYRPLLNYPDVCVDNTELHARYWNRQHFRISDTFCNCVET